MKAPDTPVTQAALSWEHLIPTIEPLVYQVRAGATLGTAFVISVTGEPNGGRHCMLVTAWHVVKDVVRTDEPLDLARSDGTLVSTLTTGSVAIYPVGPAECDTALILVPTREPLVDSKTLLPLPLETMLPRGGGSWLVGLPRLGLPGVVFFPRSRIWIPGETTDLPRRWCSDKRCKWGPRVRPNRPPRRPCFCIRTEPSRSRDHTPWAHDRHTT